MENFIRIHLFINILHICFPGDAFPVGLADSNVQLMREDVKCEQDAKFYTPANVRPECLVAALECIAAELRTVRRECEDPEDVIGQAEEFLSDTIQNRKDAAKGKESNSTACVCESWPEEPFANFLDATQSLLQQVQSLAGAAAAAAAAQVS